MSKRDIKTKLNINKLNRLNEEDESSFIDPSELEKSKKKLEEELKQSLASDIAKEYEKLRGQIDQVFRLVPYCEPSFLTLIDNNDKRLEFLEQVLLNRFVYSNENDLFDSKSVKISSAAYGSYLSKSFNSSSFLDQSGSDLTDKLLNLNNLNLNNECLNKLSIKRLTKYLEKPGENRDSLEEEQEVVQEDKEDEEDEEEFSNFKFKNSDHFNLMNNFKKIKYLNLSSNSFKHIPIKIINKFQNLELIDLSDNLFESISLISLHKVTGLKELNLSNNMLKWFTTTERFMSLKDQEQDEEIENITKLSTSLFMSLERLNLSNNQLISSNCVLISQFKNLKYLNLSNNNILISETHQLPWQLMSNHLYNLIELDLSKNNKTIDTNRSDTKNQQHQTELFKSGFIKPRSDSVFSNLSSNNSRLSISRVSKSFNCLFNLKILDLSENNLVNIPSDLKDLKYLEELVLDNNQIEFLPNELTELKHLKVLSLSNNNLTEISDNFFSYSRFRENLIKLDLSKNKLKYDSFSYKIGLIVNLKILNLSENFFDLIPNTLPKNLEELNMNKNKLKVLMIRPLSQQTKDDDEMLIALDLSEHTSLKRGERNQHTKSASSRRKLTIKSIINDAYYDKPETDEQEEMALPHVFYLRNLKKLYLSGNLIQEIPTDFGVLNSSLEILDLSYNSIGQIGISLCRGLGSLKFLNLSNNRIREISDKIRELSELDYLNLGHNRLASLNYELCNELKSLKELYLNNNYLEQLPLFLVNSKKSANQAERTPSALTRSNTPHSNLNSELSLNSTKQKKQYCFNLPNLTKIDLSFNKFKSNFSLYTSFCLSTKLVEINLSSNKINFLDTEQLISSSNSTASQSQIFGDDEKAKNLRSASKMKLNNLKQIDLSNNDFYLTKGGFVKLLCNIYKLCSNLSTFIYDQTNGAKLGSNSNLTSMFDEDYYFDLNIQELEEEEKDLEFYLDCLYERLEIIDLSNNDLKNVPKFFYKLKNLKQIFFNGNFLKKIPNEFYEILSNNNDESEFEKLKKIQELRIKEELKNKKKKNLDIEDDFEEEDQKKKKKTKSKKKPVQKEADFEESKLILLSATTETEIKSVQKEQKFLADRLEILHLNNNQIEHVPQNLFSKFKSLKEIKLKNNPLKDPPQESVCISSNLSNRLMRNEPKRFNSNQNNQLIESVSVLKPLNTKNTNVKSLPNLFFEANENLKSLQSYMIKYKTREDMMLCNMFMIIKDNIDSIETLQKLMRRLKMPMDRVNYVCKEINDSVVKNWSKIFQIEYPPEPGKLRPSKKELNKKMNEYILRLQAWNLLNAWKSTFGTDAQSEELVRIFKLMNSNKYENEIYEKLNSFKLTSNMLRV